MTKLAYTAGVTFRPIKWMNIDIAYGYVNSADPERTGSYPYTNPVLGIVNEKLAAAGTPEKPAHQSGHRFFGITPPVPTHFRSA